MSSPSPDDTRVEHSQIPVTPVGPAAAKDAALRAASLARWASFVGGLAASLVPLAQGLARVPLDARCAVGDWAPATLTVGPAAMPLWLLVLTGCVLVGRALIARDDAAGAAGAAVTAWLAIAVTAIMVAVTLLGVAYTGR